LCQSAYDNDVNDVALLIRKGVDINFKDESGWTALMNAAYAGAVQTVAFLIGFQTVDVNVSDSNGETALMIAMISGSVEIVELLLSREDIDISARNSDGNTALDIANRSLRVARFSLNRFDEGLSLGITSKEIEMKRVTNLELMIKLLEMITSLESLESENQNQSHGKKSVLKQAKTAAKRISRRLNLPRKNSVGQHANSKGVQVETVAESKLTVEKEKPKRKVQKNRMRCFECRKKVGLTGIDCNCGYVFCGVHSYPGDHNCDFDFIADARERFRARVPQAAVVDKIVGEKL